MAIENRVNVRYHDGNHEKNTVQTAALPKMLREKQSAAYLGVSVSFLQKARSEGNPSGNRTQGPPFIKLNGAVYYRVTDLDAWSDSFHAQHVI